jgi:hypothetical protein
VIVNKTLFDKLSKKNQEKWLNERLEIKKEYIPLQVTIEVVRVLIYIFVISLIVLPLWKIAFSLYIFSQVFIIFANILWLSKFLICTAFAIDLVILMWVLVKLQKVNEKYFTVEVKARRV